MDATWAISLLSSISLACSLMASTTAATALSMPRLRRIGLAPAATLRRPSRTSAWASTVAVVVPSPATSLVLVATSLTSWAPMFSKGSSSSTSRAMVTPSLVIVGAPNFLSITTLRPLGPRVTLTVSASLLTPASRPRRAFSSNLSCLGITCHLRQHVAAGEDQQVLAVDGDLGPAVLRVDDLVADGDVEGDQLAGVVGPAAGADGEDLALLGLLLGGVGDDETRRGLLLGLARANDDAIVERLQTHVGAPPLAVSTLSCRVLTIAASAALVQPRYSVSGLQREPQVGVGRRRRAGVGPSTSQPVPGRWPRPWRRCPCTSPGSGRRPHARPRGRR